MRKFRIESKLENLNEVQYLLDKQDTQIKQLTSDNESLKQQLQVKAVKAKNDDIAKKIDMLEHKLSVAQSDYAKLKDEKQQVEDTNRQIIKQLGSMKELITDTKEREALNKELLIKVKAKQEKLVESAQREKAAREKIKDLEIHLQQYKETVRSLEDQTADAHEAKKIMMSTQEELDEVRDQNNYLKTRYEEAKKFLQNKDEKLERKV